MDNGFIIAIQHNNHHYRDLTVFKHNAAGCKGCTMNIFSYGSLMIPSIFKSVTGKDLKSQPARLPDYARFRLKKDSYPGIVEAEGCITDGVIYFDVDKASISKLDDFEGEYYQRTPVCVTLVTNNAIDAEAYVIKPKYRHILSTRQWCFEEFKNHFQDEFKQKHLGFSITINKTSPST